MAAYEILLLNTAIPQIQAAQSGDTYVVPRDIAINATAIISANSATDALRITQTGAGNAILVEDSANPDSTPFVVTAAGDVGVGTTNPAAKIHSSGSIRAQSDFELADSGNTVRGYIFGTNVGNNYRTNSGLSHLWQISGSTVMTLDSSGNLGLGVTPSAWSGILGGALQTNGGATIYSYGSDNVNIGHNVFFNGTGGFSDKYIGNGFASKYYQINGLHSWYTAPSGNANDPISFTQAMTLDASGNLLVGATSANSFRFKAVGTGGNLSGNAYFVGLFGDGSASAKGVGLGYDNSSQTGIVYGETASAASNLAFWTYSGSAWGERARITSGGYFKASNDASYVGIAAAYHELRTDATSDTVVISNSNGSQTGSNIVLTTARAAGTNALFVYATANAVNTLNIFNNGNITNTNGSYGTISDQRLKQDIVDAGSQWNDLKAIRFRKYRMKADVAVNPDAPALLGVVAQELEQTSPGLVETNADRDAEGNDLGTTTKSVKTSVLLMKAAVALQEAMARIEKLESEVAALKGA